MATSSKAKAAALIAAALAAPAEGLRQYAYFDPPGILTVCMGHTGPDIVKGKKYSIAECQAYMTQDMLKAAAEVDKCVPNAPESVLVAFSDATYNLGGKIACNTAASGAARALKAGDWRKACNELTKWDKASVGGVMVALPGLTKRRAMERDYCLRDVS
jgi:lysozyme